MLVGRIERVEVMGGEDSVIELSQKEEQELVA